jgi:hypothetical protein
MSLLNIAAGAGSIEAMRLANANSAEVSIEGGAAGFKIDFGGALQRDTQVRISTGVSSVEISVPALTATKVTAETVLGNVDSGGQFIRKDGALWNEAAIAGQTPVILVHASLAVGSLRLRSV